MENVQHSKRDCNLMAKKLTSRREAAINIEISADVKKCIIMWNVWKKAA
jgi:hypothetical protein